MSVANRVPNLKEVLGAMIFAANRPLTVREMRGCLVEVAETVGDHTKVFAEVKDADIRSALAELTSDLDTHRNGFRLAEVATGYRLQSDEACGTWLKHLLDMRKTNRLSQPSLETLAIIACRQPVSRTEIEGIRGVSVDHVIKALMEVQLVRIVGRSELPGRPFLYGTTQVFLDHFGLKSIDSLGDLTGMKLQARKPTVAEAAADVTEPPVEEAAAPAEPAAGEAPVPAPTKGAEPSEGVTETHEPG
ncbi:MAG: SMC-Scp complex subunit ScpB [Lentisphaerae bacterium]|nr:SMC-Scp complex subunit ScpB [Lentisphaerota bacterium]